MTTPTETRPCEDPGCIFAQPHQPHRADEIPKHLPDEPRVVSGLDTAAATSESTYPPPWRVCLYCRCRTNARVRVCCEEGRSADLAAAPPPPASPSRAEVGVKRSPYHREVPASKVDVYRVLLAFNVADPCIQHAVKKLLVAGGRLGGKSVDQDIAEVIWTLQRWQEMRAEEKGTP